MTHRGERDDIGGGEPQSRQSAKLFLQSSESGLPQPLTRRRVCPPSPVLGGGAHSLAREGLGESQFRRGDIHCGTFYIYALCGPTKVKYGVRSPKFIWAPLYSCTHWLRPRNSHLYAGSFTRALLAAKIDDISL